MSNTQHIPGPVAWVDLTDDEIEKGREQTFSINNPYCPCDSKTMRKAVRWAESNLRKKNARLIAAAPDLLEALQELLRCPAGGYDTTDDYADACKKAEAAIAKATGGAV